MWQVNHYYSSEQAITELSKRWLTLRGCVIHGTPVEKTGLVGRAGVVPGVVSPPVSLSVKGKSVVGKGCSTPRNQERVGKERGGRESGPSGSSREVWCDLSRRRFGEYIV